MSVKQITVKSEGKTHPERVLGENALKAAMMSMLYMRNGGIRPASL